MAEIAYARGMNILAIETSCDETAIAAIHATKTKVEILGNFVFSQIKIHKKYGGIVPEVAARNHCVKIFPLLERTMKKMPLKDIDLIAVTHGPGLVTSLMVGVELAKSLSYLYKIPVIPINHLEGHIYVSMLPPGTLRKKGAAVQPIEYPLLSLVVSGGHTELVVSRGVGNYSLVGQTLDDAAGEAFDKVARLMDLGYPGGPIISKLAQHGDEDKYAFPRPMASSKKLDFSFSGLKTAVRYELEKKKKHDKDDVSASFQAAVVDVLTAKTVAAAAKYKPKTVILGGGVAANTALRTSLALALRKASPAPRLLLPEGRITTDNALMVAMAAYALAQSPKAAKKRISSDAWKSLEACPNLSLEEVSL